MDRKGRLGWTCKKIPRPLLISDPEAQPSIHHMDQQDRTCFLRGTLCSAGEAKPRVAAFDMKFAADVRTMVVDR
jgi:hypothetical protein